MVFCVEVVWCSWIYTSRDSLAPGPSAAAFRRIYRLMQVVERNESQKTFFTAQRIKTRKRKGKTTRDGGEGEAKDETKPVAHTGEGEEQLI